jgi:hypothetical protein
MLFGAPMIRVRRPLMAAAMFGGTPKNPHPTIGIAARAPSPAGEDMVGRLRELKGLLDSGALTPDEFAAAKAKLLKA